MLKAAAAGMRRAVFLCALSATLVAAPTLGQARQTSPSGEPIPPIALSELPREGRATYALIREGGPFPYDKDGSVFGNRERLLPAHQRGYYREYTVRTPGAKNRGARRIVCGGKPTTPDACYYTSDHYASFREIVEP